MSSRESDLHSDREVDTLTCTGTELSVVFLSYILLHHSSKETPCNAAPESLAHAQMFTYLTHVVDHLSWR